jgi:hypothetical protein
MSSQVSSGSVAPQLEAPTVVMTMGLSCITSIAAYKLTFIAGKELLSATATGSPALSPIFWK